MPFAPMIFKFNINGPKILNLCYCGKKTLFCSAQLDAKAKTKVLSLTSEKNLPVQKKKKPTKRDCGTNVLTLGVQSSPAKLTIQEIASIKQHPNIGQIFSKHFLDNLKPIDLDKNLGEILTMNLAKQFLISKSLCEKSKKITENNVLSASKIFIYFYFV